MINHSFSVKVWCRNGRSVKMTNLDTSTNFYRDLGNMLSTIASEVEDITKIKFFLHKPNNKQLIKTFTFSSKEDIWLSLRDIEDAIVNYYN